MGKNTLKKSKQSGLAVEFAVIMAAFFIEVFGLIKDVEAISIAGFLLILAAMMYSPIATYVLKRK